MHYYFMYFRQSVSQEAYHTFNIQDVILSVLSRKKQHVYFEVLEMYCIFLCV